MQFGEFKKQLQGFTFEETRADSEDFFEGVITKDELAKVIPVIEQALGQAVSPTSESLSSGDQAMIKSFGGVMAGQSLYFKKEGEEVLFVMLWPWSGGSPITLKCGRK